MTSVVVEPRRVPVLVVVCFVLFIGYRLCLMSSRLAPRAAVLYPFCVELTGVTTFIILMSHDLPVPASGVRGAGFGIGLRCVQVPYKHPRPACGHGPRGRTRGKGGRSKNARFSLYTHTAFAMRVRQLSRLVTQRLLPRKQR